MSLANNTLGGDPYDRTLLRSYQQNLGSAYAKFYAFCFVLVKPEVSRNIDMEVGLSMVFEGIVVLTMLL